MKIGVWIPDKYLHSVRIYFEQVSGFLSQKGVQFVPFKKNEELPADVDLYWDPTCTGGKNPNKRFFKRKHPLVATVHGASNFALPHRYTYRGWKQQLKGYGINLKRKLYWKLFKDSIEGVVTVSDFAKGEIVRELNLSSDKIHAIHHGYSKELFFPVSDRKNDYLFHISVFQPVKNIPVLLEAYQKADPVKKLPLILVIPGYPEKINIEGITLITQAISQKEVAEYMQQARAFFLPSIRESFGLPLIESMATGTPVVTSYGSACEEIAKGYGMLCHATNVDEWKTAIEQISTDDNLWRDLHKKSLTRSLDFSWEKCAEQHLQYFKSMI